MSQRGVESYAFDNMVEDIEAVTRAAGLDRFSILASVFSTAPNPVYFVVEKILGPGAIHDRRAIPVDAVSDPRAVVGGAVADFALHGGTILHD